MPDAYMTEGIKYAFVCENPIGKRQLCARYVKF
jgi:hypothetical protein